MVMRGARVALIENMLDMKCTPPDPRPGHDGHFLNPFCIFKDAQYLVEFIKEVVKLQFSGTSVFRILGMFHCYSCFAQSSARPARVLSSGSQSLMMIGTVSHE